VKKDSSFFSCLEPWDLDGGGVCFLNCLAPFVGMTVPEFYILSHNICEYLCETVNYHTDIFVSSNFAAYFSATVKWWAHAEITATAYFISRYFLIYIRGGFLGVDEIPNILAHH